LVEHEVDTALEAGRRLRLDEALAEAHGLSASNVTL
jgi:hypothetical protein